MNDATAILDTLIREVDAGRSVALCAIVATRGSTPQPPGVCVCVDEAARMTGTLGGGCVEADVRRQAHQQLAGRGRTTRPLEAPRAGAGGSDAGRGGLLSFTLDDEMGEGDGMICGGRMDVAVSIVSPSTGVEPFREALARIREGRPASLPLCIDTADGPVMYRVRIDTPPQLLIAGAGHISRILADLTVRLGFRVHVVDDRADYAHADRFAAPIQTEVADIASALKKRSAGPNTYVVIVTRGHKHDAEALRAVLGRRAACRSPARYIGMIGSRRKIDVIFEDLRRSGAGEEELRRVHAPIGLDIGAVTTDEIAVSIAAELISVRRGEESRRERSRRRGKAALRQPAAQVAVEGPFPLSDAAGSSRREHSRRLKPAAQVTIRGIIPAAGMSRRMGRRPSGAASPLCGTAKQTLRYGDSTLTGTVARTLLEVGVAELIVVTRRELVAALDLPDDVRLRVTFNDDAESDMLESVRIGLAFLAGDNLRGRRARASATDGILVVPGDMPSLRVDSCQACVTAFAADPRRIVIATCHGKRGHPIIFPWALRAAVAGLTQGLRQLAHDFADRVLPVETHDSGVTRDVDTPEEYDRL